MSGASVQPLSNFPEALAGVAVSSSFRARGFCLRAVSPVQSLPAHGTPFTGVVRD